MSFAIHEGNVKVKIYQKNDPSLALHEELLKAGLDLPKVVSVELIKAEGYCEQVTKKIEWVEGKDFDELRKAKELTAKDWYEFGVFLAKINKYNITIRDVVHRNILRRPDGSVIFCDLRKLYRSYDFVEEPIVRFILNNVYMLDDYKEAVLNGYRTIRPHLSFGFLLKKELDLNYDGYQDLYLKGDLIKKGVRSNKRLAMLKDDFKDKKVLDLGCSSGAMFARHARANGAYAVTAIDKVFRNPDRHLIDLPALLAYREGLVIQFLPMDIEGSYALERITDTKWDIIFFTAMLGHIAGDRVEYVKRLADLTKVMYFESNLGGKEDKCREFLDKIGFSSIECLGESGDPDRDPNNHYVFFRCSR